LAGCREHIYLCFFYIILGFCAHLLFLLLIVALSVSIFSLYSIKQKQKQKKVCGLHNIFFRALKKILQK